MGGAAGARDRRSGWLSPNRREPSSRDSRRACVHNETCRLSPCVHDGDGLHVRACGERASTCWSWSWFRQRNYTVYTRCDGPDNYVYSSTGPEPGPATPRNGIERDQRSPFTGARHTPDERRIPKMRVAQAVFRQRLADCTRRSNVMRGAGNKLHSHE